MLILAILETEPAHGYAVIESVRRRSEGVLDLSEGTIYPLLHRLERRGELASKWKTFSGRRRRVYRLTRKGRRALAGHRGSWSLLARAVAAVMGEPA